MWCRRPSCLLQSCSCSCHLPQADLQSSACRVRAAAGVRRCKREGRRGRGWGGPTKSRERRSGRLRKAEGRRCRAEAGIGDGGCKVRGGEVDAEAEAARRPAAQANGVGGAGRLTEGVDRVGRLGGGIGYILRVPS